MLDRERNTRSRGQRSVLRGAYKSVVPIQVRTSSRLAHILHSLLPENPRRGTVSPPFFVVQARALAMALS